MSVGHNTQQLVLSAASQLTAAQFETYQRLSKRLLHGPQFQLLLADCQDEQLQLQLQSLLQALCQQAGLTATILPCRELSDVFALQQQLQQLAAQYAVIQLAGAATWFSTASRWADLNLLRENIAAQAPCRLLFWLDERSIATMISESPDWWAWRGGVYHFASEAVTEIVRPEPTKDLLQLSAQHHDQTVRRIAVLNQWLQTGAANDAELAMPLWVELAELYKKLGEWDKALAIYQHQCLPKLQQLVDLLGVIIIKGKIADIWILQGKLAAAHTLLQDEVLPALRPFGDKTLIAINQGRLADILVQRGNLSLALQIRQQQELPHFEQAGDLRSVAMTQGKIADILVRQHQLEPALTLLSEQVLPLFQKLNDRHSISIVQSRIAEIYFQRGQTEQALQLLQQQVLPIQQKLGDQHAIAVCQSKIADMLAYRGEYQAALQLLQTAVLPVLQQLHNPQQIELVQQRITALQARLVASPEQSGH
jgi:tetratricopeptide (TPR) repeat protein